MGWVYVVTHANAKGLFKIGITRNPANRKDQLGGDDLTVMAMLLNWNPEGAEKRLHQKYKAVRLPQSEWFNLSMAQVAEIVDDLQSQHGRVMAYVVTPELVHPMSVNCFTGKAPNGPTKLAGYEWNESKKMFCRPVQEEAATLPPPIPTLAGEPRWDRDYRVWRYINKEGFKSTSSSMQEALNNQ